MRAALSWTRGGTLVKRRGKAEAQAQLSGWGVPLVDAGLRARSAGRFRGHGGPRHCSILIALGAAKLHEGLTSVLAVPPWERLRFANAPGQGPYAFSKSPQTFPWGSMTAAIVPTPGSGILGSATVAPSAVAFTSAASMLATST
jgi:hypothetical protein